MEERRLLTGLALDYAVSARSTYLQDELTYLTAFTGPSIQVSTGVHRPTLAGTLADLAAYDTVLSAGSYQYRQIVPGIHLTIQGQVTIETQYVFAPTSITICPGGSLTVHAGRALWVDCTAQVSAADLAALQLPTDAGAMYLEHQLNLRIITTHASPGRPVTTVSFDTVQLGDIRADLNASGGQARNGYKYLDSDLEWVTVGDPQPRSGGDGGRVELTARSAGISGSVRADGHDGDHAEPAGTGGSIIVLADRLAGSFQATAHGGVSNGYYDVDWDEVRFGAPGNGGTIGLRLRGAVDTALLPDLGASAGGSGFFGFGGPYIGSFGTRGTIGVCANGQWLSGLEGHDGPVIPPGDGVIVIPPIVDPSLTNAVFAPLPGLPELPALDAWTILVYANGNGDLEGNTITELHYIEQFDYSAYPINVVVQLGRSKEYSDVRLPSSNVAGGNWSGTRRAFMNYDGSLSAFSTWFIPIENESQDMASPESLTNFINWAKASAPAERYALVMSGHGAGWKGLSFNGEPSLSRSPYMTLRELGNALRASQGSAPLAHAADVVILDACDMQTVEVATELVGEAEYLLASESPRGNYVQGTDIYQCLALDKWLMPLANRLAAGVNVPPNELVSYAFHIDTNQTRSVIDLKKIPALNEAINRFALAAVNSCRSQEEWNAIKAARKWIEMEEGRKQEVHQFFNLRPCLDLAQYMRAIMASKGPIPQEVRDAAGEVLAQVSQAVPPGMYRGLGEGIGIYLPSDGMSVDPYYTLGFLRFCNPWVSWHASWWQQFIRSIPESAWWQQWTSDWGNTLSDARLVDAPTGTYATVESQIDAPDDVDFVSFNARAGDRLMAWVCGGTADGGLVPTLTLYASDRKTVLGQATADLEGVARLDTRLLDDTVALSACNLLSSGDPASDRQYYLAITSAGNLDPLSSAPGSSDGYYSLHLVHGDPAVMKPTISLGTDRIDFGTVDVAAGATLSIEVTNTGGSMLSITEIHFLQPSSPFEVHPTVFLPIQPGETVRIPIAVHPASPGLITDVCTLVTNDPDHEQVSVSLLAVGIAVLAPHSPAVVISTNHPNDSRYGQKVTLTANIVSEALDAAEPAGVVQFIVDGACFGDPVAVSGGTASLVVDTLLAGSHSIAACYTSEDASIVQRSDADLTIDVAKAPLTITVANKFKTYGQDNPTLTGALTGVVNGDGITASYATAAGKFSDAGSYAITASLNDPCNRLANYTVTVTHGTLTVLPTQNAAFLSPDPLDPTKTVLSVFGASRGDVILIQPGTRSGDVAVWINGKSKGSFRPTGHIAVFGLAGNDLLNVSDRVTVPVRLYGNEGNDILRGGGGGQILFGDVGNDCLFAGKGNSVLVGGSGRDSLLGGRGRNVLIGGDDLDILRGGTGDSLLIGGRTTYDANEEALINILAEWTRAAPIDTRIGRLKTGMGLAGGSILNSQTVRDDRSVDLLFGGPGDDWYLKSSSADLVLGFKLRRDRVN